MRSRLARSAPWLLFGLFAALATHAYLTPIRAPAARPEAHADGIGYYVHLRSLVFDRDFSYANDYALLGHREPLDPDTQLAVNVFPVGPVLFWLPFVPVAHLVQQHASAGAPKPIDGSESAFQRTVFFGSVAAGLLVIALAMISARRITDPLSAALVSIGVATGSPLLWYMLRQPSYAHAADAAVVALLAAFWLARYGSRAPLRWLALGGLLGVAMLTRPQNACHVLLPLAEWTLIAVELARAGNRAQLLRWAGIGVVFVLGALLAFAPLALLWRYLYGGWTLLPQGHDFMMWNASRWDATLFSSRGGLYAWHPLLAIATAGLFGLALAPRVGRELRLLAVCALGTLALQAFINGAARDWWAGWAFGGRRFLSCTFYFMLGLAAVVEAARKLVPRCPRALAQLACAVVLLGFAGFSQSLSEDYLAGRALPDRAQHFAPHFARAARRPVDGVYSWLGNPGSWPASLWFALRARTSPAHYDVAGADDIFPREVRIAAFDDDHAMAGFAPSGAWMGRTCRTTRTPHAIWTFTLRARRTVRGTVTLAASQPGVRVRMTLAGEPFFDEALDVGFRDYDLQVPRALTATGLNYVQVEQQGATGGFAAWEKVALLPE